MHLSNSRSIWLTSIKVLNQFDSHLSNSYRLWGFYLLFSYTLRTGSQPICACSGQRSNATLTADHFLYGPHTKSTLTGGPQSARRGTWSFCRRRRHRTGTPSERRCRPPDAVVDPPGPRRRPPGTPRTIWGPRRRAAPAAVGGVPQTKFGSY